MAVPNINSMTVAAFDEWATRPENADKRLEYVGGEVVVLVSNDKAAKITFRINGFLFVYLAENDIGEATGPDGGYIVMGERYIPDVAFIRYERQTTAETRAYYPVAPDLAVEVISNKDNDQEMRTLRKKIGSYIAAGTLVWIVDPDTRSVEVYAPGQKTITLSEDNTLTGGDILPGFTLAVKDIFPAEK